MKRFLSFLLIVALCILIVTACSSSPVESSSATEDSVTVLEDTDSDSILVQPITTGVSSYYYFPEDLSKYEGKTVIHWGILNYIPAYDFDSDLFEQWNDYLIQQNSSYVVQLVGCVNPEFYNKDLLEKTEAELGYTFDLVSYQVPPMLTDIDECMQSLDDYFQDELAEVYALRPEEYWQLGSIGGHIYDISDRTWGDLYSFGCDYSKSIPSQSLPFSDEFVSGLSEGTVTEALTRIGEFFKDTPGSNWRCNSSTTGIVYLKNIENVVRIPFEEWATKGYFAYVAPLVGVDYLSESDEIICLFESPTFKAITEQYQNAAKNRQLSETMNAFDLTPYISSLSPASTTSFHLDLGQAIYYAPSYYEGQVAISIRKGTSNLVEVLDMVRRLSISEEDAVHFYLNDSKQYEKNEDGLLTDIPHLPVQIQFLNCSVLIPRDPYLSDPAYLQELYPSVQTTPLAGFSFDETAVKDEIQAIRKFLCSSDLLNQLESGEKWESWPELTIQFRQQLDELGLQKIREEANRQYQAWKK